LNEKKPALNIAVLTGILSALLVMTHNLMTLMFVPVILVWCGVLYVTKRVQVRKIIVMLCLIGIVALGLSAHYVLPSLLEKDFTRVETLISGYGSFEYHFLYIRQLFHGIWGYGGSVLGLEDGMSFAIGYVLMGLFTAALVSLIFIKKIRLYTVVFAGVSAVALFLTIFKSSFVWKTVPLMRYFQFPWRFLSLAAIFIPLVISIIPLMFEKRVGIQKNVTSALIVLLLIVYLPFYKPQKLLDTPDALFYSDKARIAKEMSGILPDYIPKTADGFNPIEPLLPRAEMLGQTQDAMKIVVDRTHQLVVRTNYASPETLLIRIFSFPGWTPYLDMKKTDAQIQDKTGFYLIQVPKGEHLVTLLFEDTPVRFWSTLVSAGTVLTLVIWYSVGSVQKDAHGRTNRK
jgi:hypothetical protein